MQIETTNIADLVVLTPRVFKDERGYFMETYTQKKYTDLLNTEFVQDNESQSAQGVLRGLHFQKPPFAQAKLVRVIQGSALDVAVDLRKNSPTYGKHYKVVLTAENKKQFFIPAGFAHGFVTLEADTIFSYKCSAYYEQSAEDSLRWNDPDLAIDWEIEKPQLTEKDAEANFFATFKSPF